MSLARVQTLLARLYTDSQIREDFIIDPIQVGRDFHLSEAENGYVSKIVPSQIRKFSGSLTQKRLNEVRNKLSLTSKVLDLKFNRLFYQFAQKEAQDSGVKKRIEVCYRFSRFIVSVAKREGISPWVLDLMRYEIMRMKAVRCQFGVQIFFSLYGIKNLIIDVMYGKNPPIEAKIKITIGLWVREPIKKKLWHRLF